MTYKCAWAAVGKSNDSCVHPVVALAWRWELIDTDPLEPGVMVVPLCENHRARAEASHDWDTGDLDLIEALREAYRGSVWLVVREEDAA